MTGADVRPVIFPMSREQEALWLDDLVWDGPSRHLESWACRFTGELDDAALEWAISEIVARHEILRTRLTERDEQPVQVVTPARPVRLERVSCTPEALQAELSRIATVPLDIEQAPIRPWLVRVSPKESVLVMQIHHAVIDDQSLNVFRQELMHCYAARLAGQPVSLPPVPMQAGDFAAAQRARELDPADLAYWRERVRDTPLSCTIPPDHPGPEETPHRAGRYTYGIEPELGRAVRAAGRAMRATPFMLFSAALAALLWRHGEPDEVIFGTPVSMRGTAGDDGMIGVLTSLHPIRVAVSGDVSFRTLAAATKAEVLGAMQHRSVPYSEIVRMSRQGKAADAPLPCDVAMVVDDMRWEPFALPGATAEVVHFASGHAKFVLHLSLTAEDGGGYTGAWNYDAEMFEAGTVADIGARYADLLARFVAAPDESLRRIATAAGPSR